MKLFFSLIVFSLLISCNETNSKSVVEQGKTMEYYPKANVYYDMELGKYLVYSPGKKVWEKMEILPGELQTRLGKKVTIDNPQTPVYKENANHKLIYSVSLYKPEGMREKFIEDSLLTVPVKPAVATAPGITSATDKKKRKGRLKKFLDRVF